MKKSLLLFLITMLSFNFLSYASFPVLEEKTSFETVANSDSTAHNIEYLEGEINEISNSSLPPAGVDTALKWALYILLCIIIGWLIGYALGSAIA